MNAIAIIARPIRVNGDAAYVPLTKGYEAVIDAADVPLVDAFLWYALENRWNVYAARGKTAKQDAISLHRLIMGDPNGLQIDHIDGNGLNNRRSNLRLATHAENARNARKRSDNGSGFKGVSLHKRIGKWRAYIAKDGKVLHLGYYETPEMAHAAYRDASLALHAGFGRVA